MKQLATLFALFWLLAAFAPPAKAGDPKVYLSIGPVTDAHACGVSLVTLTISNSTNSTVQLSAIDVSLNNKPNDFIAFMGIINSPNFQFDLTEIGSSTPSFTYGQPLPPNTAVTLTMQVQYSCSFFDPSISVDGYFIKADVTWVVLGAPPLPVSGSTQSPDYSIGYTAITPQGNLDAITVNYETPFEIIIPLEISGNYCDDDFTVKIQKPFQCYDFSNLSYSIHVGDVAYGPFVIPAQSGPNVYFEVSAQSIGKPPFCEANYPNGLGHDIVLVIHDLKAPCGCGIPGGQHNIPIGFSPCKASEVPSDCKDTQGNLNMQKTVEQTVTLQVPPAGNLTITNTFQSGGEFNISNTANTMPLRISNSAGSPPAYHINLNFSNAFDYQITKVKVGDKIFDNIPASNQMSLSFENNQVSNIGLEDLNGDGIYAELDAGHSFNVEVYFEAFDDPHCGLGNTNACNNPCQTVALHGPGVQALVRWNDRCNSLAAPRTSTLEYRVDVAPLTMNAIHDGAKLVYNQSRSVKMELNFGAFSGFTGYLEQNPLHRYICINPNLDTDCITFENIRINGIPVSIAFENGYADLGAVAPDDLDNTVLEFDFFIKCCPDNVNLVTLNLSYGVFFDKGCGDCPHCSVQMACGNASFLSPCSQHSPNCDAFEQTAFKVYNDVYEPLNIPVPVPAKVYPCDCLRMDVNTTIAQSLPGGRLLVGILVSDEFVNHFKSPYIFNGSIKAASPGPWSFGLPVHFNPGVYQDIADEPFGVIYFESIETNLVVAGKIISGNFKMCMASDFPTNFDKIDLFAPVVGVRGEGNDAVFCYQGFTNLYALDVDYTVEHDLSASCGTGGLYTAKLVKHGGELFGPDFPGKPRIVAKIDGAVTVAVNNGNAPYQGRTGTHGCGALGNPFNPPVTSLPTGLEADGAVLQSFSAHFDENCAGNVPVKVDFNVAIRPGANAPCSDIKAVSKSFNDSHGVFPNIVSTFDQTLGNPYYLSDNTFVLNVHTTNTGADANKAWIQLEYDPKKIEVDWAQIPGAEIFADACDKKNVLVIPIGSLAKGEMLDHAIPLRFLAASCSNKPAIALYGFHSCGCTPSSAYGCAANYSDPAACEDSYQEFKFDFFDSELFIKQRPCATTGINCNIFQASFLIDNPGEGNTENLTFRAILPPGITIVSARYGSGDNFCSTVGTIVANINELSTTGWKVPQGILYGLQSGKPNHEGRGYLWISFRNNGVNPNNDDVTIVCSGTKPCGEVMERPLTLPNVMDLWSIPPTGSLFFVPNLCHPTSGNVTINVYITVHLIGPNYLPIFNYINARILCDENNNGIADPTDPILFVSPNSSDPMFQLEQVFGDPQSYHGTWIITGNFGSCIGHDAILTFDQVWTSTVPNPIPDPELIYCISPAIGPVCQEGAAIPGVRSNVPEGRADRTDATLRSHVQPNPFTDQLTLFVASPEAEKAEVSVFNQLGAKVYSNTYPIENKGDTALNLYLADLPPGMYVLRVAANGDMKHHVLIKH